MKDIFVSIASFVDTPDLLRTIASALRQARYPERIIFAIVNQTTTPKSDALSLADYPAHLLSVHPSQSLGPSWARSLCYSFYNNEDYLLQIDSHMSFSKNWDSYLIELLESMPNKKSIISTYPYGFTWQNGEAIPDCPIADDTTLVLRPIPEQLFTRENPILRFRAKHLRTTENVLGCHVAAGFLFTRGYFFQEIPIDTQIYFHGEEQNIAIRAYTHGWDIVHPHSVPLLHRYKKAGTAYIQHNWHPRWKSEEMRQALDVRSTKRMAHLFAGELPAAFGLGQERSLKEYEELFGIDYREFHIAPDPEELL